MIQALYSAASGVKSQQTNFDVVANNIANMDTVGYKKSTANFVDALYVALTDPSDPTSTENLQQGTGAIVNSISKTYTAGTCTETGRPLDVAISGDEGFFEVESVNGDVQYTRNGSFTISSEGDNSYLVTGSGEYVLDQNGQKIALQGDLDKLQIDSTGMMYKNSDTPFAHLAVVNFQNAEGLEAVGDSKYVATAACGQRTIVADPKIKQKSLEQSNVDLAKEMSNMIKAQRAYQMSSKMITTADEMEGLANNLRR